MSAIELLEKMGADSTANTVEAQQQFWSNTGLSPEQIRNGKLWCLVIPEKDDEDEDQEDKSLSLN